MVDPLVPLVLLVAHYQSAQPLHLAHQIDHVGVHGSCWQAQVLQAAQVAREQPAETVLSQAVDKHGELENAQALHSRQEVVEACASDILEVCLDAEHIHGQHMARGGVPVGVVVPFDPLEEHLLRYVWVREADAAPLTLYEQAEVAIELLQLGAARIAAGAQRQEADDHSQAVPRQVTQLRSRVRPQRYVQGGISLELHLMNQVSALFERLKQALSLVLDGLLGLVRAVAASDLRIRTLHRQMIIAY